MSNAPSTSRPGRRKIAARVRGSPASHGDRVTPQAKSARHLTCSNCRARKVSWYVFLMHTSDNLTELDQMRWKSAGM